MMRYVTALALTLMGIMLVPTAAVGQIVEIPAMTVPAVIIDMDTVGPAGPTSLAAINAAATPTPSTILGIILTPNTAAAGVYNTNPGQGRALAIDAAGGLVLVDPPAGAFTAFDASITLGCQSTEFGCSIGDWSGPINFTCFLGGALVGTVSMNFTGGGYHYFQSQIGPFDRIDFVASTTTGNWVIPDLTVECSGPPPPVEYQGNSDESSLKINGTFVSSFFPTVITQDVEIDPTGAVITPATGTVSMTSTVAGSIYDILLNGSPTAPLSGAGLQITPTEIVNLSLASGWTSLNSSLALDVSLQSFPGSTIPGASGGGVNIPYSMGATLAPVTVSVQAVATDPASPSGFRLAGATQLDVNLLTVFPPYSTCPSTVGGDLSPLSDDGTINVALVSPFTFYGVTYSDINVNMNGNATFAAGDTDFTATEAEFLSGSPRIAPAWDDWTPSDALQGTVRTSDDGVTFACEWFDIRAFGCTGGVGDTATFCIELDYGTGQVALSYGQFATCSTLGTVLAGIGPGAALSLPNNVDLWDATLTAPNNNGPTLGATDAIYEAFGLGSFGAFDLAGDMAGTPVGSLHIPVAGNGIAFLPTAGIGVGPYIQN